MRWQSNGECIRRKKAESAGWMEWVETGDRIDVRVSAKMKRKKTHQTAVVLAMLYGVETTNGKDT